METARNARYKDDTQGITPKVHRTTSRRPTRPNMTEEAAKAAKTHDIQLEAGAILINVAGQTQRPKKDAKKALKAEKKAAEEAEKARRKGEGKEAAQADPVGHNAAEEPAGGQNKGKGKEVDAEETLSLMHS